MSNKVQLTKALLEQVKTPRELVELPAVRDNWVNTFNKITGSDDGNRKYEAEKILFLQAVMAKPKAFEKVSTPSLFGAWTELSISGLTLREGISYIVPYGEQANFIVGWKGRLEQINEMPNVIHTSQPEVVYDCDDFDYEKGEKVRILKHKPARNRTKENRITHVYMVITFKHEKVTYVMEAIEVYKIRDKYSQSYLYYMKNGGRYQNGNAMEEPMWISNEDEAFKKTIVKRVYKNLPKLPKQKWLDERIANAALAVGADSDNVDELAEEGSDYIDYDDVANIPDGEPAKSSETKKDPELVTQQSINEKFTQPAAQEKNPETKPVQTTPTKTQPNSTPKPVSSDIPSETGF